MLSSFLSLVLFASLPQVSLGAPNSAPPQALGVDVPLRRLSGIAPFLSAGVSFLDYDGDGWIDLYVNTSAGVWRNEEGATFTRVFDLDVFLPPRAARYGASAADYDNDGLPDIACSPRGDCLYVLKNLDGAGSFLEVGTDPEVFLDPAGCGLFGETLCWGDVDEDGDLDLWATAYPDPLNPASDGNQFFENLGPAETGGAYRFKRRTAQSGFEIPDNAARPEGAQFADADRDGDLDGYANGTLYQNVTDTDGPRFRALLRNPTGITMPSRLDEGAMFFDYDLDGDQDLFVLYKGFGNRIWENEGDGSFFEAEEVIELPSEGSTEGCSAEDWDLDGDLDLTTGHIFRRNLLVENGERFLRMASHSIPLTFLNFPTPAWGDWDKDGDMDCVLANFGARGTFFRNHTYEPETPAAARTSVRVRAVADSATVPRGLETEFGATIELRLHDDPRGFVRRRFVASSHGYLQQSEYALTFALPRGPNPALPAEGVRFDLAVDFPSLPVNGLLRIDPSINPILGGLELATLVEREITVTRGGRVLLDGFLYEPDRRWSHRLSSSGGLILPDPNGPLPEPEPAPAPGWVVGMELDTSSAAGALLVEELVVDGQLVPSGPGRCGANVALLDVTPREPVQVVQREHLAGSPRNDRSFHPVAWPLKSGRVYRVLCRVSELRPSPLHERGGSLANRGGLSLASPTPCQAPVPSGHAAAFQGASVLADSPDPSVSFIELRYRTERPASPGSAHSR